MQPRPLQRSECKPVWVQHQQHRIQKQEKSVGAESKQSLSSQCSCAGKGTQYQSSRPCFVLCGLFFFPKMVLLQKHCKYFVPVLRAVDMLQGAVGVVALSASCVGRTWRVNSTNPGPHSYSISDIHHSECQRHEANTRRSQAIVPNKLWLKVKNQSVKSLPLLEAWILNYFLHFFLTGIWERLDSTVI